MWPVWQWFDFVLIRLYSIDQFFRQMNCDIFYSSCRYLLDASQESQNRCHKQTEVPSLLMKQSVTALMLKSFPFLVSSTLLQDPFVANPSLPAQRRSEQLFECHFEYYGTKLAECWAVTIWPWMLSSFAACFFQTSLILQPRFCSLVECFQAWRRFLCLTWDSSWPPVFTWRASSSRLLFNAAFCSYIVK